MDTLISDFWSSECFRTPDRGAVVAATGHGDNTDQPERQEQGWQPPLFPSMGGRCGSWRGPSTWQGGGRQGWGS